MKITIPNLCLRELVEKHEELDNHFRSWASDDEVKEVPRSSLSTEAIEDIQNWILENKKRNDACALASRRLTSFLNMMKMADTKVIKRAVDVEPVALAFIRKNLPNQRLYKQASDGQMLAYVVYGVEYDRGDEYRPACTEIKLAHTMHGEVSKGSIRVTMDVLSGGKTLPEIFDLKGYFMETEELNELYEEYDQKYTDLMSKVGDVYVGKNGGKEVGRSRWSSNDYYFKPEVDNKVVIDFQGYTVAEKGEKFKDDRNRIKSQILDGDTIVNVPVHPYGHVFHLEEHVWVDVHVGNLDPYSFKGEELKGKLILPDSDKTLIGILIEMSKMKIKDIVEGKSGGSFILATGIPGTGKTLTAEVFSETVEKPLYKVQCSQLGIDVDTVEKNLKFVLRRASRWGAILLIDESDVYVRARGEDINQNAIVGTFLRTLEYYTGILFMTSNMETAIDDAIMSRATAHLVYQAPSKEDSLKIWNVLGEQIGTSEELKDSDYVKLNDRFEGLVGRDIKALLKLALMYSKGKGEKLTPDTFESIYGFVPNVSRKMVGKGSTVGKGTEG